MLRKLFKRKHEFAVFIARRGGRKWVAKIDASDIAEAAAKAYRILEERVEKDPDVTRYRTIILVDLKTGYEERLANPFFEDIEGESEGSGQGRSSRREVEDQLSLLQEAAITRIVAAVADGASEMMKSVMKAMGEIMKTPMELQKEALKEAMKAPIEMAKELARAQIENTVRGPAYSPMEIAALVDALVKVATHRKDIAKAIKEVIGGGGAEEAQPKTG